MQLFLKKLLVDKIVFCNCVQIELETIYAMQRTDDIPLSVDLPKIVPLTVALGCCTTSEIFANVFMVGRDSEVEMALIVLSDVLQLSVERGGVNGGRGVLEIITGCDPGIPGGAVTEEDALSSCFFKDASSLGMKDLRSLVIDNLRFRLSATYLFNLSSKLAR